MTSAAMNTKTTKKPRRMARQAKPAAAEAVGETPSHEQNTSAPKPEKATSKASLVLNMLQQPAGATIEQMVAATGWLPHTTRAVLTGFKKKGHVVTSDKADGIRTYRIAEASAEPKPAPAGFQTAADA